VSLAIKIALVINGAVREATVESRTLLSDFLRHELRLTGTHVGCEHGVCGACTVLVNEEAVRSCLMLAAQADKAHIVTIEGAREMDPERFGPLQEAFSQFHALQCGYCTPGFLISAYAYLRDHPDPTAANDDEIRQGLSGNLCRCTGYHNIVRAVSAAAPAFLTPPTGGKSCR
jgi:aerobic carbon-monoxide dehydrogenase small subunit